MIKHTALLVAVVLLSSSLTATARRTLSPPKPEATATSTAEALQAFSQWSKRHRSLSESPAAADDMTACPADKHFKSYFWPSAANKFFFSLNGKSPCATLPSYIPSSLPKDMDFSKHLQLALYGSMQQPTQLQYTVGQQTTGWDLTTEVPQIVPEASLAKPLAHKTLQHLMPAAAQCDAATVQEQCTAMCTGMATHFQPLCNGQTLTAQSADSVVCGFTQLTGTQSKCLDACQAVQCAQ